jgi:hypothetical protein
VREIKILNIKVKSRKHLCHQKIPWIRFAGNNISNYGLILNTNSARDQNEIFIKNSNCFLEPALLRMRPKLLISVPENRIQGIRLKLKNTSHSMFTNSLASYIPKMTFLAFPQKKPHIKTSKNTLFGTFNQIADP